jgi:hypothetical protein
MVLCDLKMKSRKNIHPFEMESELYHTMVHAIGMEDEEGNKGIFTPEEVVEFLDILRNYAKQLNR